MRGQTPELGRSLTWLKRLSGVDDEYLAQWPTEAWPQWQRAMNVGGNGVNPCVPDWMQPYLGSWYWDFSIPAPAVGQLAPTAHDWFSEAENHLDFSLRVSEFADRCQPPIAQLRSAWTIANTRGVIPLMTVLVVPAEPWGEAVVGEVEAFYVTGRHLRRELVAELTAALGVNGSPISVTGAAADEMLTYAGLAPVPLGDLHAWEWVYSPPSEGHEVR